MDPHNDKTLTIEEHLLRAERHTLMALERCYSSAGITRPLGFRLVLGRAQSILIKLYIKELKKNP